MSPNHSCSVLLSSLFYFCWSSNQLPLSHFWAFESCPSNWGGLLLSFKCVLMGLNCEAQNKHPQKYKCAKNEAQIRKCSETNSAMCQRHDSLIQIPDLKSANSHSTRQQGVIKTESISVIVKATRWSLAKSF